MPGVRSRDFENTEKAPGHTTVQAYPLGDATAAGRQPRERLIPYIRRLHQTPDEVLVKNVHYKSNN
jgi:hypothetical protein